MTPKDARDYVIRHCNPDYPSGKTEWETAINMAIEALEKQIPKQMNCVGEFCEMSVMACGSCGKTVGAGDVPGRKFYYCKHCGQRIER